MVQVSTTVKVDVFTFYQVPYKAAFQNCSPVVCNSGNIELLKLFLRDAFQHCVVD